MSVAVLYLRIVKKFDPDFPVAKDYESSSWRFLATYQKFKPQIPHDLIIINCGGDKPDAMFDGVCSSYVRYDDGGYDCGAYQAVGKDIECDLVLGLNTHTYLWRYGWLEPFVKARETFGPGVYGASASLEINPHLRTPAIAFSPEVIAKYPHAVNNRQGTCDFEHGPNNFGLWADRQGYPSLVVTGQDYYAKAAWRSPKNGFRQGDQSDVLVWDRHTDLWRDADQAEKSRLNQIANGVDPKAAGAY